MKRHKAKPSPSSGITQKREVVGKVPAWELWAQSVANGSRGQQLIDAGAFTAIDFMAKTGWTYSKAERYLNVVLKLRSEKARDPRQGSLRKFRFYFPPS